ncbi:Uncharacterised protein [Paucimonas lemoignei]|nr:Uncharacterised protein [Paucimonas lemoignei]
MDVKLIDLKKNKWLLFSLLYKKPERHRLMLSLLVMFALLIPISSAIHIYDVISTPSEAELVINKAVLITEPLDRSKEIQRVELVQGAKRTMVLGMCSTLDPQKSNIKSGEEITAWMKEDVVYQIENSKGQTLKPTSARFTCSLETTLSSLELKKTISFWFLICVVLVTASLSIRTAIVLNKEGI